MSKKENSRNQNTKVSTPVKPKVEHKQNTSIYKGSVPKMENPPPPPNKKK
jgi:hypothetical protein